MKKVKVFENIEEVTFNKPDTIVIFKDGSKIVTKCSENDIYDPFVGYLIALAKYVLPKKYNLVKLLENMYYPDIYFTNYYHNNIAYTILNDKTNNNKYVTDGVDIPGDNYYDCETRKLICLLKRFANDYGKYKKYFIDRVYNMIKTSISDKVDTKLSDMCKYIKNNARLRFSFGSDVIMDNIHDSILKILPTMNIYESYPESLIKGCRVQRRNGRVPFEKRIDYTKYNIDKFDNDVNNASIYKRFLIAFNSTGKCSVDEYRQHGLLGLMSELGELKEVLIEIDYTKNPSDEKINHMYKELSDIYWMLCEYTTYCGRPLVSYSFAEYIRQSILFHQINNTKHFDYNNPIASNNGPYNVAIDVVDTIILNVSKIANIYQKILQGHNFNEFGDQHFDALFSIYKNVVYLSRYVLDISLTNIFSIGMDKVKKRYPDGWMDPERSINRKPEDV